jgi:hypothetical protein
MKPKYEHFCEQCVFQKTVTIKDKEKDVYLCGDKVRTIVIRHSDDPPDYSSGKLFECVTLTQLDKFALFNYISLTEEEEKRLLGVLAQMFRDKLSMKDYQEYCCELKLGNGNVIFPEPL